MATTQISNFHKELKSWIRSLSFYKEEAEVFENRLEEVVTKNTKKALLAEAEHFQNQFILQKEEFDILKHDIVKQEKTLVKSSKMGELALPRSVKQNQPLLRDRMQSAEKIFIETKHDFHRFVARVL